MPTTADLFRVSDLATLTDMDEAATFAVFHHPELLTIDSAVRDKIIGYIQKTPAFLQLTRALGDQGIAQTPDSDYEGWANGVYLLDAQGKQIADGKGGNLWTYQYTDDTKAAMLPVIQQAISAVRNDSSLAGVRYEATLATPATFPVGTKGFVCDRQGWSGGCRTTAGGLDATGALSVNVANRQFRYLGAYARFLDAAGNVLALTGAANALDTPSARFLGVVPPRPLILGATLGPDTSAAFQITAPANTRTIELLAGSFGTGNFAGTLTTDGAVVVPGGVLSVVMCSWLPALYLACGMTSSQVQAASPGVLSDLATYLITFSASATAKQVFQSAAAGTTPDAVNTKLAYAVLGSVFKDNSAALTKTLTWLGAQSLADVALVSGCVLEATDAAKQVSDVSQSPWVLPFPLRSTVDVQLEIGPDAYQFPAAAKQFKVNASLAGQAASTVAQGNLASPSVGTVTATLVGLPPLCPVNVAVQLSSTNSVNVGTGSVMLQPPFPANASITVEEAIVPLTSSTTYAHRQTLTVGGDGKHAWNPDAGAPTATQANLGGNMAVTLEALSFLTLSGDGRLGYGWKGKSPNLHVGSNGPGSAPVFIMQSINLVGNDPDARRQSLSYGFTEPVLLASDYAIVPAVNPRSKQSEYHVRQINLGLSGQFGFETSPSWGRFASTQLTSVAVHPAGVVVALNGPSEKIEVLRLPSSAYAKDDDAEYALQIGGQGVAAGLLHGGQAVALSGWDERFFVLEQVNQRVQAFDLEGNPLAFFGGSPFLSLAQWPEDSSKTITYLDLKVSADGYFFILSFENDGSSVSQYRLDVYSADGSKLCRTTGVAGARLAVDRSHAVYTLNYQLQVGANSVPEPSVSLWMMA